MFFFWSHGILHFICHFLPESLPWVTQCPFLLTVTLPAVSRLFVTSSGVSLCTSIMSSSCWACQLLMTPCNPQLFQWVVRGLCSFPPHSLACARICVCICVQVLSPWLGHTTLTLCCPHTWLFCLSLWMNTFNAHHFFWKAVLPGFPYRTGADEVSLLGPTGLLPCLPYSQLLRGGWVSRHLLSQPCSLPTSVTCQNLLSGLEFECFSFLVLVKVFVFFFYTLCYSVWFLEVGRFRSKGQSCSF